MMPRGEPLESNGEGAARPDPFESNDAMLQQLNGQMRDAIMVEKMLHPEMSDVQLAQSIYDQSAPAAAMTIAQIATRGTTERARLDAAKYITDRSLGRITEHDRSAGKKDPLVSLLEEMYGEDAVDNMKGVSR